MIRYIVLITVVIFVSVVILILHFYLKNNKYEAEIESEKVQEIWELQKKNLEVDLREANIKLNPHITLTETTRIVEEIQSSIIKTFKTDNTLVIPHPGSSSSSSSSSATSD